MTNIISLCLAVIAGLLIGIQAAINGDLGKKVGTIEAALISFFVGLIILALLVVFLGKGNLSGVILVPKWNFLGGILGSLYLLIMIMVVPRIGMVSSVVSIIVGQLVISIMFDHFGWFVSSKIPLDSRRVIGMVMLIGALFFIFKGKS